MNKAPLPCGFFEKKPEHPVITPLGYAIPLRKK
jgi:hypothetical protein